MSKQRKRTILALAVALVTLGGTSELPTDAVAPEPLAVRANLEPARDLERERLLDLILAHRVASVEGARSLADAICAEARRAEVDPLFVGAIVAKESSFRSAAVSHAGAVGLMQLRPWVAHDVARRHDVDWQGMDTLHAPELNVRLGVTYYKELMDRFEGDAEIALTAYNAGPTRVSAQLRRGTYRGSDYAAGILELYGAVRSDV